MSDHERLAAAVKSESDARMDAGDALVDGRITLLEFRMQRWRLWTAGLTICFLIGITLGVIGYVNSKDDATRRACQSEHSFVKAIQIAIPEHHVAGRTPEQQQNVDRFYAKLDHAGILHPAECQ